MFAPRSFLAPLFFKNPSPEALLTSKTRGFPARKPPQPRFGYLFGRKTQPNNGLEVPAAAKPRILRLRSASGERFLETVAPCSSLVPASRRSSLLRSSLLPRLPPCSSLLPSLGSPFSPRSSLLRSSLLPRLAPCSSFLTSVFARALVRASVRALALPPQGRPEPSREQCSRRSPSRMLLARWPVLGTHAHWRSGQ